MEKGTVIESTAAPLNHLSLAGVLRIPAVRQVILLIGVAAAVAAGFAVVLWSQAPNFTQLYGSLAPQEAAQVAEALKSAEIPYKVNDNGSILVPEARVHTAKMTLASQGLPQSVSPGMESMQEQSSFGVSQFMESARYQHALESELARTISSLGAVSEARVHLALPKQTTFIRDTKKASASVLLKLYLGRTLEPGQASAIVHLVASSVPNLVAGDVTLIDQNGRLLSSGTEQSVDAVARTQFKYARQLEENYKRRIEDLLTPLVGMGRVRAEVVADIDFTYIEETRESFDPARSVVRSEQLNEDRQTGPAASSAGIPGALSNQPPQAAASTTAADANQTDVTEAENSSRSSTRNYEVDRTIRHTRPQSGGIRKLSVAVVIDETPLSPDSTEPSVDASDLERYTALVKEAVGFSDVRGDTVVVLGEKFLPVEAPEKAEPPAFWEKAIFRDSARLLLGTALVLVIVLAVVRPMLRGVVQGGAALSGEYIASDSGLGTVVGGAGFGTPQLAGSAGAIPLPNYDEKVAAAKNITGHDPARVAQVVKKWVNSDE